MFYFRKSPWIIRNIPPSSRNEKIIYLTFDDGPDPQLTPKVLDLLRELGATASFFVIGQKVALHPELVLRMMGEGHSVHSHSSDHRYDIYFRQKTAIKNWISASLAQLGEQTGRAHLSFRPPAGVVTPPMVEAASELNTPLILWTTRFFDTTQAWTAKKALANAAMRLPGDIVLLHDHQKPERQELFLESLRVYINALRNRGFELRSLKETGLV